MLRTGQQRARLKNVFSRVRSTPQSSTYRALQKRMRKQGAAERLLYASLSSWSVALHTDDTIISVQSAYRVVIERDTCALTI